MENLTHSLLGAAIAGAALPRSATDRQRGIFYVTGVLAANLPDADLLYTAITPGPLGYLLHHRGHTHTVVGLVGLALLVGLVVSLPWFRRDVVPVNRAFVALVIAALGSHLVADSWNSYGVHPFYPFDNRWFYGDAIYIVEPWFWILLGVSAAMNARTRLAALLVSGLVIALPIVAALLHVIAIGALLPLGVAGALLFAAGKRQSARARSLTALASTTVFVGSSFALGTVARARAIEPAASNVVDIILSPQPANPLCWSALRLDRGGDTLALRHGTIGLADASAGCASGARWASPEVQSIAELRTAAADDCRVRAWLQFGRAPIIRDGWISDARFGGSTRGNFTAMQVAPRRAASDCPANLTHWGMPRADLIAPPSLSQSSSP